MLYNYFRIAWRNLLRNKTNSFINIGGLAIGITCVLFIVLYVQDELRFDRGFAQGDQIFQVNMEANFGGLGYNTSNTPPPSTISLRNSFPEVTAYTRLYQPGSLIVHNDAAADAAGHSFTERRIWAVDSNFLQVFSFALAAGDVKSCLTKYHSIVLTESMARKYFGDRPALGKTLTIDTAAAPYVVTAILRDLPGNSTLQFDGLTPLADNQLVKRFSWSWVWTLMQGFVVLNKETAADPAAVKRLEAKFPAMVRRDAARAFERIGQPFDEFIKKGGKWDFYLQPLSRIHLYSAGIGTPYENLGSIRYVYIFSVIAVFIILLACINFMNLSTAQAAKRAKEVGVRKVLGGMKVQMMSQFLSEALLYTALATLLAVGLLYLLMPAFDAVAGKQLSFADLFRHGSWAILVLAMVATGLLAGSYPAFYLTSFKPVDVLKGGRLFARSFGNQLIRNGLVVFQFTVSIALMVSTLIVYRQLQFMNTADLGFNKDHVVVFPNVEKLANGSEAALRQQLSGIPGMRSVSVSSGSPANMTSIFTDFYVPVANGVKEHLAKDVNLTSYLVDEYFVPSLQMQLVAGRNFSRDFQDSASVIVNESTARLIGWKNPLGKRLRYPGNDDQTFTVVGVVKDFNFQSLRDTVAPFALFHTSSKTYKPMLNFIVASVDSRQTSAVLQQAGNIWKQWAPSVPFDYSFLDKDYAALYQSEEKMGRVFGIFTSLSIIVACLGLFGLSVYTAERRVKEIGIRKILGASVPQVMGLLSMEFLKLVGLSVVIAFPLAGWAMSRWLMDFAYRTPMSVWLFVAAGVLALAIALLTVSGQALKAAVRNPARSLRSE
jgi:putative ABC transport system permease protein